MEREQRTLIHKKKERDTVQDGLPRLDDMKEGESVRRYIRGFGIYDIIRKNGQLHYSMRYTTKKDHYVGDDLHLDAGTLYLGTTKFSAPDIANDNGKALVFIASTNSLSYGTPSSLVTEFGSIFTDGSIRRKTTRITDSDSPYTVTATDHKIFADTDGGDITTNVLTAISTDGKELVFYNTGGGTLTISADQNIDGSSDDFTMGEGTITLTYETTEGWR